MCALSIGLAFLCHLSIVTGITKWGYCEGFHNWTSSRYFLVSGGIEGRPGSAHGLKERLIPYGGFDDKVYRFAKEPLQFFQQAEVRIRIALNCFRLELNEEVEIASIAVVLYGDGRAEQVEGLNAVPVTQLADLLTPIFNGAYHSHPHIQGVRDCSSSNPPSVRIIAAMLRAGRGWHRGGARAPFDRLRASGGRPLGILAAEVA